MSQRVIITGGLGALGAATAAAFTAAGAEVVIIDRAEAVDNLIGGVDLSSPSAATGAFAEAFGWLGGVDVVVNVAGGFRYAPMAEGDSAIWTSMFAANLQTCANMCQAAMQQLSDGGAIVNVGAAAAERAGAGMAAYAASKAGVARLTESLAAELKGRVRVNAVLPAIIDTPQNRLDMPDADPNGWTSAANIADVIVFLASPKAEAINGALIPVTNPARKA